MNHITRRGFGWLAGLGTAGLMAPRALAAAPQLPSAEFDPMPYVHPELRPYAKSFGQYARSSLTSIEALKAARHSPVRFGAEPVDTPAWIERVIPGLPGQPEVKIFIINAGRKDRLRPAILHMHGGGFILGSAQTEIGRLQVLSRELDTVIVTVDYRLSPETAFPGALEDNYAALKWLHGHAEELGADPAYIAVMGESAGGGHAAMLAIAARNRGEVPIAFQALVYPMLDDRTGSTVRTPPWQGALIWTPESNRFGWTSLLGIPAGSQRVPAGAVPAREENLKGLPPTFIGVGSIDLFVGEDIEYGRRLLNAGVLTEVLVVPGGFHGFDMFTTANVVQRYKAHFMAALRQGLGL